MPNPDPTMTESEEVVTKLSRPRPFENASLSLESIQNDIKRSISDLLDHKRRLDDYSNSLKAFCDDIARKTG